MPLFHTSPVWLTDAEHGSARVRPIKARSSSLAWIGPTSCSLPMMPQGVAVLSICQHQLGDVASLSCKDIDITVPVSGIYHMPSFVFPLISIYSLISFIFAH